MLFIILTLLNILIWLQVPLNVRAADVPEGLQPIWNMCRRSASQSIVIKGILLIDTGYQTFDNGTEDDTIITGVNEFTIAYRLDKSWSAGDNGNLSNPSAFLTSKFGRNTVAGTHPPETVRGAMFESPTGDSMFLWGGTTSTLNSSFTWAQSPPDDSQYSLWEKPIISAGQDSMWLQHTITDQNKKPLTRQAAGAKASATDKGLAFHFNGLTDSGTSSENFLSVQASDSQFHSGMIKLDLVNMVATNMSTEEMFPRARAGAEMVYIPDIGAKGILVLIGGGEKDVGVLNQDPLGALVPMSKVHIFDIASMDHPQTPNGTWYNQTTTGDIPPPRSEHCLTVSTAQDGSSHNIYMFGGWDGGKSYDDVYILSLPSFKWIKVDTVAEPTKARDARFRHGCHMSTPRQMLVTGGQKTLDLEGDRCDIWNMSVSVFDPTTLKWGFEYTALSRLPYEVPEPVFMDIGGSAKGGAKQQAPISGWSSKDLSLVFQGKEPNPPPSRKSNKARIGLIVGVIFAVLGLISLVIFARWYFMRRRTNKALAIHASLYVSKSQVAVPDGMGDRGNPEDEMSTRPARTSWAARRMYGHDPEIAELPADNEGTLQRIEIMQNREVMQRYNGLLHKASESTLVAERSNSSEKSRT